MKYTMNEATKIFLSEVKDFSHAYRKPRFHFVAARHNDGFHIVRARLFLSGEDRGSIIPQFSSDMFRAGQYWLSDIIGSIPEFLEAVSKGRINTPDGDLIFDHQAGENASIIPFHPEGLAGQYRLSVLVVEGDPQLTHFLQPMADWHLKSRNPPYDSVAELMAVYRVGLPDINGSIIEIVADQLAQFLYNSPINGTSATPTVQIHPNLDKELISLGIRIIEKDGNVIRKYFSGSEMKWGPESGLIRGEVQLNIPDSSVLQCFVNYKNTTLHYGWMQDPAVSYNPRKTILQLFDDDLQSTRELIFVEPGKGKSGKSRDLEIGVASLLWLLGFSPISLGSNQQTSESVDIVAVSPSGNFILVECTTGLITADKKLSNLVARTTKVRRELEKSNSGNLKILPIIVTSRFREEVSADLEQAKKLGILVVSKEDLEEVLRNRVNRVPNADAYFNDAESAISGHD